MLSLLAPALAAVTVRDIIHSPHLGEIEIAAYVDDDIAPAERERAEAHLDECAECRQAVVNVWKMSREVNAAVPETTRTAEVHPRRNHPRRLIGATAVLLAASMTIVVLQRADRGERAAVVRAPESAAESPAVSPVPPRDGASVERDALVLRWSGHPPALFRVALLDSTGSPVIVE